MLRKTACFALGSGMLLSVLLLLGCAKEFEVTGIQPHSGTLSGGETVKISGSGFVAGMGISVYFGNFKAPSVIVDNPNTLSVVSPAGKGSGMVDIRIVTDDGREYLLKRGFRYIETQSFKVFDAFGREKTQRHRATPETP